MINRRKVAWGITGSGDKLKEILDVMKQVSKQYRTMIDIKVFLSKAGNKVIHYYSLIDELKGEFNKVFVEVDSTHL